MAQRTPIEWSDYSSNPLRAERISDGKRGWFCTHKSAGCEHCYSEAINKRFGTGLSFTKQNEDKIRVVVNIDELLSYPKIPAGSRVFVCDMTDIFHEKVTDDQLDVLWRVFAINPHLTFQVLTKRADRMRDYLTGEYASRVGASLMRMANEGHNVAAELVSIDLWHKMTFGGLPNLWLGVSVEDQKTANERIRLLLSTPAALRFLSVEPLLSTVDLTSVERENLDGTWTYVDNVLTGWRSTKVGGDYGPAIDWVIVGGESGPGARPCNLTNVRHVVFDCQQSGVPVFVKQLGARPFETWSNGNVANTFKLASRKGGDVEEWPEDLRVREFPAPRTLEASA